MLLHSPLGHWLPKLGENDQTTSIPSMPDRPNLFRGQEVDPLKWLNLIRSQPLRSLFLLVDGTIGDDSSSFEQ